MIGMEMLEPEFLLRFGVQIFALLVLLKLTFYRYSKDRDALFSYTMFGHGVFIAATLLRNVEISMGFAFGLFAIFSMLRYRTESISVRNMTYLFLVIVVSLVSSVGPVSPLELVGLNALICLLAWLSETRILAVRHEVSDITYANMGNLKPQVRGLLLADLNKLTGLDVKRVEILERNYKNKTAKLRIFYRKPVLNMATTKIHPDSPLHVVSDTAHEQTGGKRKKPELAYVSDR